MSTSTSPTVPAAAPSDAVANQFVDEQLQSAQASLRRVRVISIAAIVFVAGYMTFITWTLQTRLLQPKAAADLATSYTSAFVQEQGNAAANQLIHTVPGYIGGLPDVFLRELPTVRHDLENQLEYVLTAVSRNVSKEVGVYLDDYLVNNHQQIADFLSTAQNPQFVEQFGEHVEKEVLGYLKMQGADGQSTLDKLQQIGVGLAAVETKLHRLAYAKDLSPEEQALRQLIAITMRYSKEKA